MSFWAPVWGETEKDLLGWLFGRLFGCLIKNRLLEKVSLATYLRCILNALTPPEDEEPIEKMFQFGRIALEQFIDEIPKLQNFYVSLRAIDRIYEDAQ